MTPELQSIRDMLRRHAPRISRWRMLVLVALAAAFVWVLMGARKE